MGSFDSIDYSLRPNKSVERKLILELLGDLCEGFPIGEYRYIGMGSMWFVDFKLLHKNLAITDMISIEREAADRAIFNRPYDCVQVVEGEASVVLPTLDLDDRPAVIWLDYEGGLAQEILGDIGFVGSNIAARSVVAVTVNAHHRQLKEQKDEHGIALREEEALRRIAGNLTPEPLSTDAVNRKGFPATVLKILQNALDHAVRKAGRNERFLRLFAFTYKDGAPMATVGGMVLDPADQASLAALNLSDRRDYVSVGGDEPYVIDVPPLTSREKSALDRLLPMSSTLTPAFVQDELRFSLKESQLASYQRFYRQYPLYGEVIV